MRSTTFSAIISTAAQVMPVGMSGFEEASTTANLLNRELATGCQRLPCVTLSRSRVSLERPLSALTCADQYSCRCGAPRTSLESIEVVGTDNAVGPGAAPRPGTSGSFTSSWWT